MHGVDRVFHLVVALWFALVGVVAIPYVATWTFGDETERRRVIAAAISRNGLLLLSAAVKLLSLAIPHAQPAATWIWLPLLALGLIRLVWARSRKAPAQTAYSRSLQRVGRKQRR